jgi:hypothetical protein
MTREVADPPLDDIRPESQTPPFRAGSLTKDFPRSAGGLVNGVIRDLLAIRYNDYKEMGP